MQSTTEVRSITSTARFRIAAGAFAIAVLIHNGDHLRRGGRSLATDVFVIGTLALVVEVAVVWLAFMNHRHARLVAAVAGVTLAAGYYVVHFTPQRPWLSDSFVSGHGSVVSILAALGETLTAIVLAAVAVADIRDGVDIGPPVSVGRAARHPVVAAMLIGNAIALIGTVATR
jgi:hypothetical protein